MYPTVIAANSKGANKNVHMYRLICTVLFAYPLYRFSRHINRSQVMRKPVFRAFDQVRHKPASTATNNVKRLVIRDLGSRRIVLII